MRTLIIFLFITLVLTQEQQYKVHKSFDKETKQCDAKIEECEKVYKCPIGKKKEGGRCVRICPKDKVFIGGKCVKDKCAPGQILRHLIRGCACPPDQIRVEGRCICPAGQLKHGRCVRICPPDKVFRENKCVKDKCAPGLIHLKSQISGCSCPQYKKLEEGRCICKYGQSRGKCYCPPGQISRLHHCVYKPFRCPRGTLKRGNRCIKKRNVTTQF